MKRLVDRDPLTGIETWHELRDGKTVIHYVPTLDVGAEIDYCTALANDNDYTRRGMKEGFWHYAHIPAGVMLKWYCEEGVPLFDAYEYNKRANRPEYKRLKVTAKYHDLK